jgi:hypothetical protein
MAKKSHDLPATNEDAFKNSGYTVKRSVTLSSWPWIDGELKAFRVIGPIHAGTGKKGSNVPPPNLCLVRDLKTKKHYQLILGKMIFDALSEIPSEKLVGKCFAAVRSQPPDPDANWKQYDVREIEPPEDDEEDDG